MPARTLSTELVEIEQWCAVAEREAACPRFALLRVGMAPGEVAKCAKRISRRVAETQRDYIPFVKLFIYAHDF